MGLINIFLHSQMSNDSCDATIVIRYYIIVASQRREKISGLVYHDSILSLTNIF